MNNLSAVSTASRVLAWRSMFGQALACVIAVFAIGALRVDATPVPFGANYYEFVQVPHPIPNNTWAAAQTAATTSVFHGVHGHLATITSAPENGFLLSLAAGLYGGFAGSWLGGYAGGWLVGPEAGQGFGSYSNWGGIEPNNGGLAYMNIGGSAYGIGPGQWADDSGVQGEPSSSDPVFGYFVEYESPFRVPENPAAWSVLFGMAGLLVAKRKLDARHDR